MSELAFERVDYSVRETGTEIRRALRAAFPGVKFSLRGSRGTGYGWFSLSWIDGPATWQADEITNGFRSSYFDGMTDSTHSIPATMDADPDGVIREHRYACNGVNATRHLSDAAQAWARSYVDAHGGPEHFTRGYGSHYDIAIHGVLSGVDLTGVDWSDVPMVTPDYSGRHVATSYCLETGGRDYRDESPRHRAV